MISFVIYKPLEFDIGGKESFIHTVFAKTTCIIVLFLWKRFNQIVFFACKMFAKIINKPS